MFEVSQELLTVYRERNGNPDFWGEPFNAISNGSFLIAAILALSLAHSRYARSATTTMLSMIVFAIGCGSFLFHTVPNLRTLWLDIIPISLFQIVFLWLLSRRIVSDRRLVAVVIVIGVVGLSFALLPVRALNGSLFYLPGLLAMFFFGRLWAKRIPVESHLILVAAFVFAIAIGARSMDWIVPWQRGTHFLWHLMNGFVVFLMLRAWIVAETLEVRRAGSD